MVEVIAEIGSCHDGSLDQALELIRTAKDCGADIVKAQYWSSAKRMAERRKAQSYLAAYEAYRVPSEWLPILAAEARRVGLVFACSSYLPEDVATVAAHAEILKISSFEANDPELLGAHALYACQRRRIIISLGMNGRRAHVYSKLGHAPEFLHCVSAYPAPLHALGLENVRDMELDGYSDHSGDLRVGGWAVAAGARIIESHLRLDTTDNANPDAGPHALCPETFAAYVREIRDVEQALHGDSTEAEAPMARYVVR
jgi:sialic acid synthase SpsE